MSERLKRRVARVLRGVAGTTRYQQALSDLCEARGALVHSGVTGKGKVDLVAAQQGFVHVLCQLARRLGSLNRRSERRCAISQKTSHSNAVWAGPGDTHPSRARGQTGRANRDDCFPSATGACSASASATIRSCGLIPIDARPDESDSPKPERHAERRRAGSAARARIGTALGQTLPAPALFPAS